jgi:hypothetical protein
MGNKKKEIIKRLITLKAIIVIVGLMIIGFFVEIVRLNESTIRNQKSLIDMEGKIIQDKFINNTNNFKN